MVTKNPYVQDTERPLSPKEVLPTMHDLPDEEEGQPGMPDIFHVWQARLLDETFRPPNYEPEEIFTASDLNIYYNPYDCSQHKRPDWFAVVGLPKLGGKPEIRRSYVIWQEVLAPLIVVELLSPSTEKEDLGQAPREANKPPTKWEVYEQWLRVPYYVVFSRYTDELRIFKLSGPYYQEIKDHQGRLWIEKAELGLGLWQGRYLNEDRLWLRWYDREGNWIPTLEEYAEQQRHLAEAEQQRAEAERQRAEAERQRAEAERQRAEAERQRAEAEQQRAEAERKEKEAAWQKAQQLAARLRELGIDPDRM